MPFDCRHSVWRLIIGVSVSVGLSLQDASWALRRHRDDELHDIVGTLR